MGPQWEPGTLKAAFLGIVKGLNFLTVLDKRSTGSLSSLGAAGVGIYGFPGLLLGLLNVK